MSISNLTRPRLKSWCFSPKSAPSPVFPISVSDTSSTQLLRAKTLILFLSSLFFPHPKPNPAINPGLTPWGMQGHSLCDCSNMEMLQWSGCCLSFPSALAPPEVTKTTDLPITDKEQPHGSSRTPLQAHGQHPTYNYKYFYMLSPLPGSSHWALPLQLTLLRATSHSDLDYYNSLHTGLFTSILAPQGNQNNWNY